MNYNLETYFLLFMIYSFLGWLFESIKMIFHKNVKHFVNRGVLTGPYLPIYGFGVLLIDMLLGKYKNDLLIVFVFSLDICGSIEYFTSWILEKLFDARWWDYKARRFNLNGRICLETLIPMGIAGVVTVRFTNPFFAGLINLIPIFLLHIISLILLFVILLDFIICIHLLINLKSTEVDLSSDDDTEAIGSYLQDKTEDIYMQWGSEQLRKHRKRKIKMKRKMIHLRLRVNKKISYEYKETIRRTSEFKEELKKRLEESKQNSINYTEKIKEKYSQKSLLHKRLLEAFPMFKYNKDNKK